MNCRTTAWAAPNGRGGLFLLRRLAGLLNRFKENRIVVSYYAHPKLEGLYPGWTVVECTVTKSLVSQGKRDKSNKVLAPEVLLINGPSFTSEETGEVREEVGNGRLF